MSNLPTTAARTAALGNLERKPCTVLELTVDKCSRAYGVSPCTAGVVGTGTAQGAAASSLTLAAGASAVDDAYNKMAVAIISGAGAAQQRVITDYVGASKLATVDVPWSSNMLLHSQALDNATWLKYEATVTGNAGVAPDGTTTADTLLETTLSDQHYAYVAITTGIGTIYTLSGYFHNGIGRDWVRFGEWSGAGGAHYAWFNLTTGAVGTVSGCTATMELCADGWYRCIVTFTATVSSGAYVFAFNANADGATSYVGDVTKGVYAWGIQLEVGSTATPYIATTSTAVALPNNTSVYNLINRPNACYNTFATCQDTSNYNKTTQTIKLISRGVMSPPGESLRPYLLSSISAPTSLDIEAGLAARNAIAIMVADETDNDSDQDPYYATRATPAGGTYWPRWLARNKNYFGRTAKLRRGFVAAPWDWTLFLDELYIIDNIAIENNGQAKITLKDPLKLTDNNKIPLPTNGITQSELKDVVLTGYALAGGLSSITFPSDASALDDAYNGMEVYIYANMGAGQRRIISDYVGATRVATISVAWSVTPDTASAFEVSALSITVGSGRGAQYADPATSGKAEYIRIGSEIIRYTVKSSDTLSWPDASYRAQFGSTRADHSASQSVQQCRAYIDRTIEQVITALITESGIAAGYISGDLATECAAWYGPQFNITACLSAPEQVSKLLSEILKQIGAVMWWSPQTQKIEFKAVMPSLTTPVEWTDEANLIHGGTQIKNMDNLRITQAAIDYALRDATTSLSEPRNFERGEVVKSSTAESANEYGDVRPQVTASRWFGIINGNAMWAVLARDALRRYDAPKQITVKIDPKDYTLPIGALVDIKTHKHVGADGQQLAVRCMITQMLDRGAHLEIQARSTNFNKRYAFIAPNGQPNFGAASAAQKKYCYIAGSGGTMSDGSEPYRII